MWLGLGILTWSCAKCISIPKNTTQIHIHDEKYHNSWTEPYPIFFVLTRIMRFTVIIHLLLFLSTSSAYTYRKYDVKKGCILFVTFFPFEITHICFQRMWLCVAKQPSLRGMKGTGTFLGLPTTLLTEIEIQNLKPDHAPTLRHNKTPGGEWTCWSRT